MLKWFSISGIAKEVKRIRWPSAKDLIENSTEVVAFTFAFGLFFVGCELVISFFLKMIGIG